MWPARGGVLFEHLVHLLVVAEEDGGQRPRVQPEDVPELPPVLVQLLHRRPAEAVQVPDEGEAEGGRRKSSIGQLFCILVAFLWFWHCAQSTIQWLVQLTSNRKWRLTKQQPSIAMGWPSLIVFA